MQWPQPDAAAAANSSTPAGSPRPAAGRTLAPSTLLARRGLSDRALAWLFIGPTVLLLLAFNIFPLLWTVWLSFTNYRANRPGADVQWVGSANYRRVLADEGGGGKKCGTTRFPCWLVYLQLVV